MVALSVQGIGKLVFDNKNIIDKIAQMTQTIQQINENFQFLEDWESKYEYLIGLGKELPPMILSDKNEQTKVRGCMSQVWLVSKMNNGLLEFNGDSDSVLVKGLIALLMHAVNEKTPEEISNTDIKQVFVSLGLENNISMNRRNGFYSMVERIDCIAKQEMNKKN